MGKKLFLFSAVLAILLLSLASWAQNAPSKPMQGHFQSVVFDYFEQGKCIVEHWFTTDEGERFVLHFKDGVEPPEAGSRIEIRGQITGDQIVVENFYVLASPRAIPTTGEQRICIILFNWQDYPVQNVTPQKVYEMFFNPTNSIDHYWREASFGKAWATGNVYGWYTLPINMSCSPSQWRAEAIKMADPDVNFLEYNRLFLLMPEAGGCGWGGLGTLGSEVFQTADGPWETTTSWCRSEYYDWGNWYAIAVSVHEGGHNFGLLHANAANYGNDILGAYDCNACGADLIEYADRFNSMGGWSNGHYNAHHKQRIGWLEPGNVVNVNAPGLYALDPWAAFSTGTKSLRILRKTANSNKQEHLWLEWRQPIGFDSTIDYFNGYNYNGLLMHFNWTGNTAPSYLLDHSPADNDFHNAAFLAGQTWTDYYTGLVIRAIGEQNGQFFVQVGDIPLVKVEVIPNTITGSETTQAKISLLNNAPSSGVSVALSTDRPDLISIPNNVTVPGGSQSVFVDINTDYVNDYEIVTITASLFDTEASALLTIMPSTVDDIKINPISVTGGKQAIGQVMLRKAAPPGGVSVQLESTDPNVQIPNSVFFAEGQNVVDFVVDTQPVKATTKAKVIANLNGTYASANIEVVVPVASMLEVLPGTVGSGETGLGRVHLSGPAPEGGVIVKLKSGNKAIATVPDSVVVPQGQTSAEFPINTLSVPSVKAVSLFATRFETVSNVLKVNPPSVIAFTINPNSVKGGNSATGTITLSAPAVNGLKITLSSADKNSAWVESMEITPGSTTVKVNIKTAKVSADKNVTFKAASGSSDKTAGVTVKK